MAKFFVNSVGPFFYDQSQKRPHRLWRLVAGPFKLARRHSARYNARTVAVSNGAQFIPHSLQKLADRALEWSWHALREPWDEIACAVFSPEQLRRWTGKSDEILARQYFVRAMRLAKRNRIAEAGKTFASCLRITRDPNHFFWAAEIFYHGLGRLEPALALWSRADEMERKQSSSFDKAFMKYQVIDDYWALAIGHISQLDYLIKKNILEGRNLQETIFYSSPNGKIGNRFMMEQWRPYLRLVRRPEDLPFPEQAMRALRYPLYAPRESDGTVHYFWTIAAKVYRRWQEEGRGPLLTFPQPFVERGRAVLERAGLPRDAWFVCIHVREGGYHAHDKGMHAVRNANITDYLPAIEEITRRGGWVIRMGDPSMRPLPDMPNVFDYCHSNFRPDWMDIFLAAKCRFFIGTSSGITYVSHDYGVPSVLTNWWPSVQRPWMASDIFIPKLCKHMADGRYLTLAESLKEPFGYSDHLGHLEEHHGVTVEDNNPEDIRAAVVEMLDRLDGAAVYNDEDLALRADAHLVYERGNAIGSATLARDFLKETPFAAESTTGHSGMTQSSSRSWHHGGVSRNFLA